MGELIPINIFTKKTENNFDITPSYLDVALSAKSLKKQSLYHSALKTAMNRSLNSEIENQKIANELLTLDDNFNSIALLEMFLKMQSNSNMTVEIRNKLKKIKKAAKVK